MAAKNKHHSLARRADKYDLYQRSVQAPDNEVAFFHRVFKKTYGRQARILREDFCGTFLVCCEWVRSRRDRVAYGIDIDAEPLEWGRAHNLASLKADQQKNVQLRQEDVCVISEEKADVIAAQNFSFWIFKSRKKLREYFSTVWRNLDREGIFVLDMMGGTESMEEDHEDITSYKGFDYVWDQDRFDPITHDCRYFIHFRFKDGSQLKKVFRYDWRFWTLAEVRELLDEAGFKRVDVYWEGTDRVTGDGNDVFSVRRHAPNEPAWICYIVATK